MINESALQRVHELLSKRMRRRERWEAMKPVRDAIMPGAFAMSGPAADMMADARVKQRRSTVNLEEKAKTYEARVREDEQRKEADLMLLRRRTALLNEWLEMLS